MSTWKQECTWLFILYRMLEAGDEIPLLSQGTDYQFIEKELDAMHLAGLLELQEGKEFWIVSSKGKSVKSKMLGLFDQLFRFEIFSKVFLDAPFAQGVLDEHGNVRDHFYDPRFGKRADQGGEDLRIAMMTFLAMEFEAGDKLRPERIIFMQWLAEGKLLSNDAWFYLMAGTFFQEIEKIVANAYKWTDTADDVEQAKDAMKRIYTAGNFEQRKRDGHQCSKCHIPLAVLEYANKEAFKHCPNPECNADFTEPKSDVVRLKCPKCYCYVSSRKRSCYHCGAVLDFTLPMGMVSTENKTKIWTETEDFVSYGYYDPFEPSQNRLAFAVWYDPLW